MGAPHIVVTEQASCAADAAEQDGDADSYEKECVFHHHRAALAAVALEVLAIAAHWPVCRKLIARFEKGLRAQCDFLFLVCECGCEAHREMRFGPSFTGPL